jgi:DNA-binding transcriptional LysR family regulator
MFLAYSLSSAYDPPMDPSLIPALHDAVTVARCGSVALAAERLHKTPSAVSQQLRRLAEALGAPLFERRGRGLTLSAVGQQALPAITRLFDEAAAVFGVLGDLSGTGVSLLRIAASDYIGRSLLVPVLRQLASAGAPLHFEITTVHSEEALRRLERGQVDLAIVSVAGERPALASHTLFEQAFLWLMPRRGGPPATLDQRLTREPVLRLAPGSGGRRLLDHYLEERRLRPTSTIDVPSVSLLLAYAAGGVGIGLVPALACEGVTRERIVLERAQMPLHPVRLVTRALWHGDAAAERFVAELIEEARRHAATLPQGISGGPRARAAAPRSGARRGPRRPQPPIPKRGAQTAR